MEMEYRELLFQEMRLGEKAELVRPYLQPWLDASRRRLLDRLAAPLPRDELIWLNAMAVMLGDLESSMANDIAAGDSAREEFRRDEGVD